MGLAIKTLRFVDLLIFLYQGGELRNAIRELDFSHSNVYLVAKKFEKRGWIVTRKSGPKIVVEFTKEGKDVAETAIRFKELINK